MAAPFSSDHPEWREKFPFSRDDWDASTVPVRAYVLEQDKRIVELEARLNQNSRNSNRPPSTDNPYKKPPEENSSTKSKGSPGAKKGHQGHGQALMAPTGSRDAQPAPCSCGGCAMDTRPFHTHQVIELPVIATEVTHFVLHEGECALCGSLVKAEIPPESTPGYGPRLTALIGEMSGIQGGGRRSIQVFCASVLGFAISLGPSRR